MRNEIDNLMMHNIIFYIWKMGELQLDKSTGMSTLIYFVL